MTKIFETQNISNLGSKGGFSKAACSGSFWTAPGEGADTNEGVMSDRVRVITCAEIWYGGEVVMVILAGVSYFN